LAGADALLRRAKQVDSLEPHAHGNVAGLEHGADLDGKGLATGITLAEAETVSLAPQPTDLFAGRAAVRTDWAIGPQSRFDVFVSGFFAMEMGGGKVGLYGLFLDHAGSRECGWERQVKHCPGFS
jgi:hypothetical protein